METDPSTYEKTDSEIFDTENYQWLMRILKLYKYLGEPHPAISKDHPSHFFREPGFRRDIEVSPDGSEGVLHSHQANDYRTLSPEELESKLQTLHSNLKEKALQKVEKILLRELATKKLEEAGIY